MVLQPTVALLPSLVQRECWAPQWRLELWELASLRVGQNRAA